jgi:hypothetical protein
VTDVAEIFVLFAVGAIVAKLIAEFAASPVTRTNAHGGVTGGPGNIVGRFQSMWSWAIRNAYGQ